jgi:hypothetical protein
MGKRAVFELTPGALRDSVGVWLRTRDAGEYAPLIIYALRVGSDVFLGGEMDRVEAVGFDGWRRSGSFRLRDAGWQQWDALLLSPNWEHVYFRPQDWVEAKCVLMGTACARMLGTDMHNAQTALHECSSGRFNERLFFGGDAHLIQHAPGAEVVDLGSLTKGTSGGRNMCDAFSRREGVRCVTLSRDGTITMSSVGQCRFMQCAAQVRTWVRANMVALKARQRARGPPQTIAVCALPSVFHLDGVPPNSATLEPAPKRRRCAADSGDGTAGAAAL